MRKLARECVYKLIFAYLFTGEWDEALKTSLFQEAKLTGSALSFAEELYAAAKEHLPEAKAEVAELSTGFSVDRIFKADLAALILGVVEMRYLTGIDAAVSIDQAVGLCRVYSAENSPQFVNGVLSGFLKKRAGETA